MGAGCPLSRSLAKRPRLRGSCPEGAQDWSAAGGPGLLERGHPAPLASLAGIGCAAVSDETKWPEEPAERVRELVEGVLDELDLDGEVEIREDDDRIEAAGSGQDDAGLAIGKSRPTLDARPRVSFQAAV